MKKNEGPLLQVENLSTGFETDAGLVVAVDGVSFAVERGRTLGIVGESGCGKSVTALSIMRLLPRPSGQILSGLVRFDGRDLLQLPLQAMHDVRGGEIGMVFQEPMTALNPSHRVGKQLGEVLLLHGERSKQEAWRRSVELLERVGIPSPEERMAAYPHQLSGGMRQRVVIAMALACKPKLLIADEPTTALDVTIQAQILDLINDLQREMGMAVILITHDLGVIAETCDDVVVMYAGRVVERGPVDRIFHHPQHLYTKGLLESIPRLDRDRKTRLPSIEGMVPALQDLPAGARFAPRSPHPDAAAYVASAAYEQDRPSLVEVEPGHLVENHPVVRVGDFLRHRRLGAAEGQHVEAAGIDHHGPRAEEEAGDVLRVQGVRVHFPIRSGVLLRKSGALKAVDGVDLTIRPGETLGLVGESGCGKSTLAKAVVRLHDATEGSIVFDGRDLTDLGRRAMQPVRRDIQMIFQDPAESLNPRLTVGEILEEPFKIHKIGDAESRKRRVAELLEKVGLQSGASERYPFEFSGGQRQRIGIARAIALEPKLVVCDEPVSALDVSVQSQILNLLLELQREMGLAYLFIAHDLSVVKHISDRIAIMYLGRIVESGDAEGLYSDPRHPYTRALISAIPVADPRHERDRLVLTGDVPSPIHPPAGCAFHTRCPFVQDVCRSERPDLRPITKAEGTRRVACHFDLFEAGALQAAVADGPVAPKRTPVD
jgi:peptide/nickel transport system ATP-binding protein